MAAIIERYFDTSHMLKKIPPQGDIPPVTQLLGRTVRLVWPAFLEVTLMGLVSLVDTMMVGTLGTVALSAVGLTTLPRFFSMCPLMALGGATSSLIARRVGEKDQESANRILHQCLLIGGVLMLVISALCCTFTAQILTFCGAGPDTLPFAVSYYRIVSAVLICNCITTIINAAQRGAGNTKIALRTNIASNVVNVVMNYLLIGGHFGFPKLGVVGAAVATVMGISVGTGMAILSVLKKDGFLRLHPSALAHTSKRDLNAIIRLSSGSLAEQICLHVGFLLFTLICTRLGTRDFAVHNVCMNIMDFVFFFGEAFSIASVTLAGQSLGQNRPDMARIYAGICQRMGLLVALGVAVLFTFFAPNIMDLFSDDPVIIADGARILHLEIYCALTQICTCVYSGCLRGAGDVKYVAGVGLVGVTIVRPLFAWFFCWHLGIGLFGAWIGFAADQTVRFLLFRRRFSAGHWTKIRL